MNINFRTIIYLILFIIWPNLVLADEINMGHEHNTEMFHSFRLELDTGSSDKAKTVSRWDLDGAIGGDINKLWLKSEGELLNDDKISTAEYWGLYSRNIADFWDGQIGFRYDAKPQDITYLTMGFKGLAPYFFETEAHLFVSNDGDVSARLKEEQDLNLTQKIILKPYLEINFSFNNVENQEIGRGFTNGEFGIQTRYEITKKFAPYFDLRYENKFGSTSRLADKNGEDADSFVASLGLMFKF